MTKIKELRKRMGLTQEELAKRVGVGQSAVATWETTDIMPSADKLPLIAKALSCSIDELFAA